MPGSPSPATRTLGLTLAMLLAAPAFGGDEPGGFGGPRQRTAGGHGPGDSKAGAAGAPAAAPATPIDLLTEKHLQALLAEGFYDEDRYSAEMARRTLVQALEGLRDAGYPPDIQDFDRAALIRFLGASDWRWHLSMDSAGILFEALQLARGLESGARLPVRDYLLLRIWLGDPWRVPNTAHAEIQFLGHCLKQDAQFKKRFKGFLAPRAIHERLRQDPGTGLITFSDGRFRRHPDLATPHGFPCGTVLHTLEELGPTANFMFQFNPDTSAMEEVEEESHRVYRADPLPFAPPPPPPPAPNPFARLDAKALVNVLARLESTPPRKVPFNPHDPTTLHGVIDSWQSAVAAGAPADAVGGFLQDPTPAAEPGPSQPAFSAPEPSH